MYNYIYAHTTVSFIVSQIYVYLCDDDDDDDDGDDDYFNPNSEFNAATSDDQINAVDGFI